MNTSTSTLRPSRLACMFLGGAACFLAVIPPATARPPQSRQSPSATNEVGSFFFRLARKLEQPVPNTEARMVRTKPRTRVTVTTVDETDSERIRRPQLGTNSPKTRVWDPVTHQWLPPDMVPQRAASSSGGAIMVPSSQPSMPAVRLQSRPGGSSPVITDADINLAREQEGTLYLDPYAPESTDAERYRPAPRRESMAHPAEPSAPALANATKPAAPPKTAEPAVPAEYGARVPGKPGFVYPPGVEHEQKNMLDVRGLSAGQKVRDPRDGKIFLVP